MHGVTERPDTPLPEAASREECRTIHRPRRTGLGMLLFAVLAAVILVALDRGRWRTRPGGAGEYWWADVPEIERAYRSFSAAACESDLQRGVIR